jgi:hypothetical protein
MPDRRTLLASIGTVTSLSGCVRLNRMVTGGEQLASAEVESVTTGWAIDLEVSLPRSEWNMHRPAQVELTLTNVSDESVLVDISEEAPTAYTYKSIEEDENTGLMLYPVGRPDDGKLPIESRRCWRPKRSPGWTMGLDPHQELEPGQSVSETFNAYSIPKPGVCLESPTYIFSDRTPDDGKANDWRFSLVVESAEY